MRREKIRKKSNTALKEWLFNAGMAVMMVLAIVAFFGGMFFLVQMIGEEPDYYDETKGCTTEVNLALLHNNEGSLYVADRASPYYGSADFSSPDTIAKESKKTNSESKPVCSDAEVNISFNSVLEETQITNFVYGIKEVEERYIDEPDGWGERDSEEKSCSYVDSKGDNGDSRCYTKEITPNNNIYKYVNSSIDKQDVLSQLNWKKKPAGYKFNLNTFDTVVIPDLNDSIKKG